MNFLGTFFSVFMPYFIFPTIVASQDPISWSVSPNAFISPLPVGQSTDVVYTFTNFTGVVRDVFN